MFRREDVLLGALRSPEHELVAVPEFGGSRLLAGAGTAFDPQPVDLFHLHRSRVQRRNNCVSHARMNLLQVLMWLRAGAPAVAPSDPAVLAATEPPLLSVDWGYAGAQHLAIPGFFPDAGSSCVLLGKFIRDHGVVTEASYPEEGTNGLQIPDANVWRKGAAAQVFGMHRLAEGPDAPAQLAMALAVAAAGGATSSNIVLVADDAMGAVPDDGTLEGPGGKVWGGHDLAVLAFDPKRGDRGEFAVADTWGRRRFWLPWDHVATYGREMLVTEAAPAAPVR